MLKEIINTKIHEMFAEYQELQGITSGDIDPMDALELDCIEAQLNKLIERVCAYQQRKGGEKMRYKVRAYLCTNFVGLIDDLETDDFYEAQDFVESNCRKGFNCELVDNELGTEGWFHADDFAEDQDDLFDDLLMEQREQM